MPEPATADARMRSTAEIVAVRGPRGTMLPTMRSDGMVALRRTGGFAAMPHLDAAAEVHLVGTAAGPLTGHELTVRITVGAGARLCVRSSAATLAMPARVDPAAGDPSPPAVVRFEITVGAGGHLDLATEPLVVVRGADLRTVTDLVLDDGASAVVLEQVVLGRHGEDGGRWEGRTLADVAGRAVLRHTVTSSVLPGRALVSRLVLDGRQTAPAVSPAAGRAEAVLMPLARGGSLSTATGPDLAGATLALLSLQPGPGPAQGASADFSSSAPPGRQSGDV